MRVLVVEDESLPGKVWDEHADPFTTTPRDTVSQLRRAPGEADPAVTVPGAGHRPVEPGGGT